MVKEVTKMKEYYAVYLEGQGDMEIMLVGNEYWTWLHNEKENPPSQLLEDYISEYGSEYEAQDDIIKNIQGGESCWTNDRALALAADRSVKHFRSISDYTKFVVDYNVKIIDEFRGYIY